MNKRKLKLTVRLALAAIWCCNIGIVLLGGWKRHRCPVTGAQMWEKTTRHTIGGDDCEYTHVRHLSDAADIQEQIWRHAKYD